MPRSFVHGELRPADPAFLRDERKFLERQWGVLRTMERQREHLVRDIERARSLSARTGVRIDPRPARDEPRRIALIGVGSRDRHDDGAGLEVVRRLRLAHPPGVTLIEEPDDGPPTSLIESWSGADEALVVEGVISGAAPGRIHRFDVTDAPLPAQIFNAATLAVGLPEAVELARELELLPGRLVVYGIEGESFEVGEGLTESVRKTVEGLVLQLYRELSGAS